MLYAARGLTRILDISVPVSPGMVTWPGDPPVELERVESIAAGAPANVSRLSLSVHAGTHVDAPLHFLDGGVAADALPLDALVGPAAVVDARAVEGCLDAAALAGLAPPAGAERLLFRTHESVALDESGARALVERGVRLVGIDGLSIGDEGAHRALLGAGVVVLEGLDLSSADPGDYQLVCAPLRLAGADGAPARALLFPLVTC